MTDEPTNNVPQDGRAIPIDWHVPEDMYPVYANHLVVQRTEQEVIISFFSLMPPLIMGTEEEKTAQLNALESIRAVCVGRIAINPHRYPDFVRVLQENLLAQPAQHGAHE